MVVIYITGIGNRAINHDGIKAIKDICSFLKDLEDEYEIIFKLRSGGANGADHYFEKNMENKVIYLPWVGFNNKKPIKTSKIHQYAATERNSFNIKASKTRLPLLKKILPYWDKLPSKIKKFHFRNTFQILGHSFPEIKSDVCVYWAILNKKQEVKGGTRTAVALAEEYGIPTLNLFTMDIEDVKKEIIKIVKEKIKE
jgi:hypothetical protein